MNREKMTNIIYDTLMENHSYEQFLVRKSSSEYVDARRGFIYFVYKKQAFKIFVQKVKMEKEAE